MLGWSKKFWPRRRIYLDTAAATPLARPVAQAMAPLATKLFGNPSSIHREGTAARRAKEDARARLARFLDAAPDEVIFTSGGTEANNLALLGVARGVLAGGTIARPGHIIVSAVEHSSVLEPARQLAEEGWRLTVLPVNEEGLVDLSALRAALAQDTVLVSVMFANNEIGVIEPLGEIAKIIRHFRRAHRSPRLPYFHSDACQATRFLPLRVTALGVDLLTLNGSKIYGPKGSGCLYLKRGTLYQPLLWGGGQERGARAGTENVAGLVGLARAVEICGQEREKETTRLAPLRDYLWEGISRSVEGVTLNGSRTERLPNNVNVTFTDVLAEQLVLYLDQAGIACSTGSACSYHAHDESHVILALGRTRAAADATIRFTLGRDTTKRDVDYVLKVLPSLVEKIRQVNLSAGR